MISSRRWKYTKCCLRLVFVPACVYQLMLEDIAAFDYFYTQVRRDSLSAGKGARSFVRVLGLRHGLVEIMSSNLLTPVAAARLWNTLSLKVTPASSMSNFRKCLKTHLFSHYFPDRKKERRTKIYFPRTITVSNKKNKETILKLARSRLPEKQKAIYAGRQHC